MYGLPVAHAGVWLTLDQAQAEIDINGNQRTQSIDLPFAWDAAFAGQSGVATLRFEFALQHSPAEAVALHTRRLGNAYRIWLNGVLIDQVGLIDAANTIDVSHAPRYITVPAGLLGANNELVVQLRADAGRSAGLTPVALGRASDVRQLFLADWRWRVTSAQVVLSVSLLSAALSLALWLTQFQVELQPNRPLSRRQRDPIYLLVAAADLMWSLRVGDVLIEQPPVPWPWWGLVPSFALGAWAVCVGAFCLLVGGWGPRLGIRHPRRWFWAFFLATLPLSFFSQFWGLPQLLVAWFAVLCVFFFVVGSVFCWQAFRPGGTWAARLVAVAMVVNALAGGRDLLVFYVEPVYGEYTYLRFTSLLFGVTLAWFVLNRFRQANDRHWDLMSTLSARVAAREAELIQSHRRLEELARQQERIAERARILRDMHDGVGSHLSTALRQLDSGRATPDELKHTLRDALDQLKLSIDAIHLPHGEVNALLANLRYRLQARFAATEVALLWDVPQLPEIPSLGQHDMRQLQFMLFEAMSNVLQHANARQITVQAEARQHQVLLRVIDDGCGFDVQRAPQNGLRTLQERARAIGAQLSLSSRPGETRVEIVLPAATYRESV